MTKNTFESQQTCAEIDSLDCLFTLRIAKKCKKECPLRQGLSKLHPHIATCFSHQDRSLSSFTLVPNSKPK